MKSSDYLKKAIEKKKMKPSEFSRFIGISESAMSRNLKDIRSMDNYTCIQVAEILNIEPMKLIAITNSERETDEEKKEFFNSRVKEYGGSTFNSLFWLTILSCFAFIPGCSNFFGRLLTAPLQDMNSNTMKQINNFISMSYEALSDFSSIIFTLSKYILCKIDQIILKSNIFLNNSYNASN